MTKGVLKFAKEIDRGDILVVDDKRYVVITVNIEAHIKSVHLEVRSEEDAFDIRDFHFDLSDPFIILGKV